MPRGAFYLHVFRSGSTRDDFDQLARDDGLASSVEKDLVLADHLAGVLGGVLFHGESVVGTRWYKGWG